MSSRDHGSSAITQKDAQTMSKWFKSGYFMTQPKSQNEETRMNPPSFLEIPTDFSGMHTNPIEPDVGSTRNWTYRPREPDGTSGICFLPSDQYRNSHQFIPSKKKKARWRCGNCKWIKSAECNIPLSCRGQSFYQSPWGRPRWEATLPQCCCQPQPAGDYGMTKTGTWHHPIAMLCTLQTLDDELRQREGIQRSKDRRGYLLQASFQETQIKDWVLYQLMTLPTSQILDVGVGQHMRPTRNSNKGRWTTHCSHNWPEHW